MVKKYAKQEEKKNLHFYSIYKIQNEKKSINHTIHVLRKKKATQKAKTKNITARLTNLFEKSRLQGSKPFGRFGSFGHGVENHPERSVQ